MVYFEVTNAEEAAGLAAPAAGSCLAVVAVVAFVAAVLSEWAVAGNVF